MATAKQLDDITECPICTEVFTDPRSLPCVHTYCLKCIREYSKDYHPGDELACPLCRKEFTLPSNGVDDLPKNFFVTNFLEMRQQLSSVESKMLSKFEKHTDSYLRAFCFFLFLWRHRWRHVTVKGQGRDPNILKPVISKTARDRDLV